MFKKLKGLMFSEDITQKDLAQILDRSQTYITDRMTGKASWSMKDVYTICRVLNIPVEEMHIYFPEGGRAS